MTGSRANRCMSNAARRLAVGLAPVVVVLSAPSTVRAQAKAEPISIGTKTAIRSAILGESRPVWIHLPRNHGRLPARYPVIYLLDGDDHFTEVTGIVKRLADAPRMPDAIIVALPNTKDRTRDLTPPAASDSARFPFFEGGRDSVTQRFPTRGGADKLLAFISQELVPWIDARYRTTPYRILIGHSFGGLFVLNALGTHPDAFRAYISLSPSLWWDDGRYVSTIERQLAQANLNGRTLYMTTGGTELVNEMIEPAKALAGFLDRTKPAGFTWTYRVMPNETHGTNPHRSEYDALESIFAGYAPPDSAIPALFLRGDSVPLTAHLAAMSRRLGFEAPVPVETLAGWGQFLLSIKRVAEGMRLLRFCVSHAPGWPGGHDALADGLAASGRKADAVKEVERAIRLAVAVHDDQLPAYRRHLARLRAGKP